MDENFRELEREAFEATFKGDGEGDAGASDAGYGLDPRQAEVDNMASAFDGAEAVEPMSDMPDEAQSAQAPAEMKADATSASSNVADSQPKTAEQTTAAPEFKTFGQAFKWHREQAANGGPGTFEWNGKKFTTQLKSEAKPVKSAAKPAKNKAAAEAEKFEREFVSRDQPPANPVDRSKTLAFREAAASQPVNLNEDPTRIKTADEIAAGVVRAGKVAPSEPAQKDGKAWYQAGPKNTFIRNGDDPKNGPIYGSKPKGGESKPATNPRADDIYRGKGTNQGEMS
jgi:hypothetical protein